jgi:hypothetical protein
MVYKKKKVEPADQKADKSQPMLKKAESNVSKNSNTVNRFQMFTSEDNE